MATPPCVPVPTHTEPAPQAGLQSVPFAPPCPPPAPAVPVVEGLVQEGDQWHVSFTQFPHDHW
jgi:hypothetical protein